MSIVWQTIVVIFSIIKLSFIELYRLFIARKKQCIQGQTVLITGAGHGIGRQISLRFALEGAKLLLLDVNEDGNKETARMIMAQTGSRVVTYKCDVSDPEAVSEIAIKINNAGTVNILVNNAGILNGLDILRLDNEKIKKCINVNLLAQFWMVKEFLPPMLESNYGKIINVSSISAHGTGVSYVSDYVASKQGVRGFTDCLREEIRNVYKKDNILVSGVYPYFVNTGMTWFMHCPTDPIMKPKDVADIIVDQALRGSQHIFIPSKNKLLTGILGSLPQSIAEVINDNLGGWIEPHDREPDQIFE